MDLTNLNPVASIEFYGYGVGANQDRASVIDDVKVTTTVGDYSATLYNYTINYKAGSDVVKTVSGTTTAGDAISIDTYLWKDAVKYKKVEGEPETLVVKAGDNTLDVAIAEAPMYSYKVKSSGDFVLVSGSYYELESVTVAYRAFYLDGTDLYAVDKTGGQYRTTFTLDADNKEVVLNASKKAENVLFYAEGEDIAGATPTSAGNNMVIRSSNAQCAYATTDLSLITLPAGTYTANTVLYSNNSGGLTLKFKYDTEYEDVVSGSSNWMEKSHDFTLTAPTEIQWLASGDTKKGLDLIYIQNTTSSYPVTIGSAGWTTLYTPYALNFAGIAGLTAYTATLSENTVTLTEVADVPANTGVVLKGSAGSYDIPVAASSAAAAGDLQGNATEATAHDAFAGNTLYILAVNEDGSVQFHPVGFGSIAAGKAFLKVGSNAVKAFDVVFTDATGIIATDYEQHTMGDGVIFNLAGQRVNNVTRSAQRDASHMKKGIYIANGKKVAIK